MSRQCTCGGVLTSHELTGNREAWSCKQCGVYEAIQRSTLHSAYSQTQPVNLNSGSCVIDGSTCGDTETNAEPLCMRSQPLNGQGVAAPGAQSQGLCASTSGRELTQQMGECRRRTQESDGAFSSPAPAALPQGPQRTGNAEPCTSGPRNGRLEVECGRSAGGSPCRIAAQEMAERGTWDASGMADPQKKAEARA